MLTASLEERFNKFKGVPDEKVPISYWGDPGRYETNLGVTVRETEEFYSTCPNIVFSHPDAFGFLSRGTHKKLGDIRAVEIPYWGRAEEVLKLYQDKI